MSKPTIFTFVPPVTADVSSGGQLGENSIRSSEHKLQRQFRIIPPEIAMNGRRSNTTRKPVVKRPFDEWMPSNFSWDLFHPTPDEAERLKYCINAYAIFTSHVAILSKEHNWKKDVKIAEIYHRLPEYLEKKWKRHSPSTIQRRTKEISVPKIQSRGTSCGSGSGAHGYAEGRTGSRLLVSLDSCYSISPAAGSTYDGPLFFPEFDSTSFPTVSILRDKLGGTLGYSNTTVDPNSALSVAADAPSSKFLKDVYYCSVPPSSRAPSSYLSFTHEGEQMQFSPRSTVSPIPPLSLPQHTTLAQTVNLTNEVSEVNNLCKHWNFSIDPFYTPKQLYHGIGTYFPSGLNVGSPAAPSSPALSTFGYFGEGLLPLEGQSSSASLDPLGLTASAWPSRSTSGMSARDRIYPAKDSILGNLNYGPGHSFTMQRTAAPNSNLRLHSTIGVSTPSSETTNSHYEGKSTSGGSNRESRAYSLISEPLMTASSVMGHHPTSQSKRRRLNHRLSFHNLARDDPPDAELKIQHLRTLLTPLSPPLLNRDTISPALDETRNPQQEGLWPVLWTPRASPPLPLNLTHQAHSKSAAGEATDGYYSRKRNWHDSFAGERAESTLLISLLEGTHNSASGEETTPSTFYRNHDKILQMPAPHAPFSCQANPALFNVSLQPVQSDQKNGHELYLGRFSPHLPVLPSPDDISPTSQSRPPILSPNYLSDDQYVRGFEFDLTTTTATTTRIDEIYSSTLL